MNKFIYVDDDVLEFDEIITKHGTHDQSTHAGARRRSDRDTEQLQPKKPKGEQEVTDPNAPRPELKPGRKPDASGSLEERAEKLANGERIEVGPYEVARMVKILAKMPGNPDLTNMHIARTELYDEDNLGIPRNKMPQVPSDTKTQFVSDMEKRGAKATRGVADPTKLHPIQAEISATKSAQIAISLKKKGIDTDDGSRIIISKDNYVIDGHHRWAAVTMMSFSDPSIRLPVIKIDMNHRDLIDATLAWNQATGIQSIGMGESNQAGQIRKWAEFDKIVAKAVRKRTVVKFQPGLRPLIKHAEHDQSTHGNWAGTRTEAGGLDAMPYEWNPKFKEKERLTNSELSSKELNLGREQLQQVATSPITIRVASEKMYQIIEDGRFKSLDEQLDYTPIRFDKEYMQEYMQGRFDLEKGLWGLPTDSLSPIYGYFDTPLQSGLDNQTRQYGDIKIVLKDSVAGRTTISPGDSANHGLTPVLVTDARQGNLSLEQVDSAYRSRRFQRNTTSVSRPIGSVRPIESGIDYFEAQVHGGVSLSDIKSVRLGKILIGSKQIALLEKAGIEVIRDNE